MDAFVRWNHTYVCFSTLFGVFFLLYENKILYFLALRANANRKSSVLRAANNDETGVGRNKNSCFTSRVITDLKHE